MGKLHKYESKIIGLPEAVAEIKDCKLQIQIRDRYEIITINLYLLYYTVCKSFSLTWWKTMYLWGRDCPALILYFPVLFW